MAINIEAAAIGIMYPDTGLINLASKIVNIEIMLNSINLFMSS